MSLRNRAKSRSGSKPTTVAAWSGEGLFTSSPRLPTSTEEAPVTTWAAPTSSPGATANAVPFEVGPHPSARTATTPSETPASTSSPIGEITGGAPSHSGPALLRIDTTRSTGSPPLPESSKSAPQPVSDVATNRAAPATHGLRCCCLIVASSSGQCRMRSPLDCSSRLDKAGMSQEARVRNHAVVGSH